MHVSKLLKCFATYSGGEPTPPDTTIDVSQLSDEFQVIKEMIRGLKAQSHHDTTEKKFTNSLSDKEALNVIDRMLTFQSMYFSDVPLSESFKRPFIFNIPKSMFEWFQDVEDKGLDDVLNPMLLFYIFNADNLDIAYGKYLQILLDILLENQATIDAYAEAYDEMMEAEEGES